MSDEEPKLIAIDEEANHQIVHSDRFGKAHGATYKPLHLGPQIDVLAFDFLRILLPHRVLLWVDMPLVRPPSIGVKPCDTERLSERLSFEEDGILPPAKDIREHGATVMVNRLP